MRISANHQPDAATITSRQTGARAHDVSAASRGFVRTHGVAIGLATWLAAFVIILTLAAKAGAEPVGPTDATPVAPQTASPVASPVAPPLAPSMRAVESAKPLFPSGYVAPSTPVAPTKARSEADPSAWGTLGSMVFPLAIVLGVIFIGVGLFQRFLRASGHLTSGTRAPAGVMQMLGRYPVGRGQNLLLIKLDQRVLLIGQTLPSRASSGSLSTITELVDGEDVASILLKVSETESAGPASAFNRMMGEAEAKTSPVTGPRGLARKLFGGSGAVVWDESLLPMDELGQDEAVRDRLSRLKAVAARGASSGGAA